MQMQTHTTDAYKRMNGSLFLNVNEHTIHTPEGSEKYIYKMF